MLERLLGMMGIDQEKLNAESEALLKSYPPDRLLRLFGSFVLRMLIDQAIKDGPPPGFAEQLALSDDPEKAHILYTAVLRAALLRAKMGD